MELKNIEFSEKFTPNIEVTTRSGSVYQIDGQHNLFIGGTVTTPTRLTDFGIVEAKNLPSDTPLRGIHPEALIPGRINPEYGKHLRIIKAPENRWANRAVITTSSIEKIREISRCQLLEESSYIMRVQTTSGSAYTVDLEHNFITGGHFGEKISSFTMIGTCTQRTENHAPGDFIHGMSSIRPGRQLSVYLPDSGWLCTSKITGMQISGQIVKQSQKNMEALHEQDVYAIGR